MSKGHIGLRRALQAEEGLSPSPAAAAAPPPRPVTPAHLLLSTLQHVLTHTHTHTHTHTRHSWCLLPRQTYTLKEREASAERAWEVSRL